MVNKKLEIRIDLVVPLPSSPVKKRTILRAARRCRRALSDAKRSLTALSSRSTASTRAQGPGGPLSALPVEIMLHIFEIVIDNPPDQCQCQGWHVRCLRTPDERCHCAQPAALLLSQVCHRWRSMALSTPVMWSNVHINSSFRSPLPSVHLERSQDAPIDVEIVLPFGDADHAQRLSRIQSHVTRAIAQAHRWRSLFVSSADTRDFQWLLQRLQQVHVPQLKALELRAHYFDYAVPAFPEPLFSGGAPALRKLSLERVVLPLQLPDITKLTSLTIEGYGISGEALCRMLVGLPALVKLEVREVHLESTFSPISFPALRTLKVVENQEGSMTHFLRAIDSPVLEYLQLEHGCQGMCCSRRADPTALLQSISGLVSGSGIANGIGSSRSWRGVRVLGLRVPGRMAAGSALDVLRDFVQAFPNVEHLYLDSIQIQDVLDVLRNLHRFKVAPQDQLWPRLTRLTLACPYLPTFEPINILGLVEARATEGTALERIRIVNASSLIEGDLGRLSEELSTSTGCAIEICEHRGSTVVGPWVVGGSDLEEEDVLSF